CKSLWSLQDRVMVEVVRSARPRFESFCPHYTRSARSASSARSARSGTASRCPRLAPRKDSPASHTESFCPHYTRSARSARSGTASSRAWPALRVRVRRRDDVPQQSRELLGRQVRRTRLVLRPELRDHLRTP